MSKRAPAKPNPPPTTSITIRVPLTWKERLETIARERDLTLSQLLRRICRADLERAGR